MPRFDRSTATRAAALPATAWMSGLLLVAAASPALRGQAPTGRIPFTQAQVVAGGRLYEIGRASCRERV